VIAEETVKSHAGRLFAAEPDITVLGPASPRGPREPATRVGMSAGLAFTTVQAAVNPIRPRAGSASCNRTRTIAPAVSGPLHGACTGGSGT
jgi:hypothetical protein